MGWLVLPTGRCGSSRTRPHHLGNRQGFIGRQDESPALLDRKPRGRILTPEFLAERSALLRAFVALLLGEYVPDSDQVLGMVEIIGIRLAALALPGPAACSVPIRQGGTRWSISRSEGLVKVSPPDGSCQVPATTLHPCGLRVTDVLDSSVSTSWRVSWAVVIDV